MEEYMRLAAVATFALALLTSGCAARNNRFERPKPIRYTSTKELKIGQFVVYRRPEKPGEIFTGQIESLDPVYKIIYLNQKKDRAVWVGNIMSVTW